MDSAFKIFEGKIWAFVGDEGAVTLYFYKTFIKAIKVIPMVTMLPKL